MATFSIDIGKQLPIRIVKRISYNFKRQLHPNAGVLEIRGFAIREFSFSPKSANCKDFLYFNCKNTQLKIHCDVSIEFRDQISFFLR